MNIGQLISNTVPTLTTDDTGNHALEVMQLNNLSELPVVSGDVYIALIRENEIMEWDHPESVIEGTEFLNYKPAMAAIAHPFDAMRIMHQMNLSVLPVIDNEYRYQGSITRETLLKYITENSGIDAPGGIIVLEIPIRNYTLYEIARICENEDVTIMNLQVHPNEAGLLEITLKLNRTSLEGLVASFERHSYKVLEYYGDENKDEDIEDNYNLLMNYINM